MDGERPYRKKKSKHTRKEKERALERRKRLDAEAAARASGEPIAAPAAADAKADAAPAAAAADAAADAGTGASSADGKRSGGSAKAAKSGLNSEIVDYMKRIKAMLQSQQTPDERQLLLNAVHSELLTAPATAKGAAAAGADADANAAAATADAAADSADGAAAAEGKKARARPVATSSRVYRVCMHRVCAEAMEQCVSLWSRQQLRQIIAPLRNGFYSLASDRNASHVIQAVLRRMPALFAEDAKQPAAAPAAAETAADADADVDVAADDKPKKKAKKPTVLPTMHDLFLAICHELSATEVDDGDGGTTLTTDWAPAMHDTHISYLVRDIIAILSGRPFTTAAGADANGSAASDSSAAAVAQLHAHNASNCADCAAVLTGIAASVERAASAQPTDEDGGSGANPVMVMAMHTGASASLQALIEGLAAVSRASASSSSSSAAAAAASAGAAAMDDSDSDSDDDAKKPAAAASSASDPFGAALSRLLARLLLWKGSDESKWGTDVTSRQHVDVLLSDRSGSHLMERIIAHAPPAVLTRLFDAHLSLRVYALANKPVANFCIQKLLSSATASSAAIVDQCFAELKEHLPELLGSTRAAVVTRLVEACATSRANTKQKDVLKALNKAVGVVNPSEDKRFVELMLFGDASGKHKFAGGGGGAGAGGKKSKCNALGVAILSTIFSGFDFGADGSGPCKQALESLLTVKPDAFVEMACDPTGSRLLDAVLGGSALPARSKHSVIDRLKNKFPLLAVNTFGSFAVEKCFAQADVPRKVKIAKELSAAEAQLNASKTGKVLVKKFKLDLFKNKPDVWESVQKSAQRKGEMFADLLSDAPAASKSAAAAAVATDDSDDKRPAAATATDDAAADKAQSSSAARRQRKAKTVAAAAAAPTRVTPAPAAAPAAAAPKPERKPKAERTARKPAAAAAADADEVDALFAAVDESASKPHSKPQPSAKPVAAAAAAKADAKAAKPAAATTAADAKAGSKRRADAVSKPAPVPAAAMAAAGDADVPAAKKRRKENAAARAAAIAATMPTHIPPANRAQPSVPEDLAAILAMI